MKFIIYTIILLFSTLALAAMPIEYSGNSQSEDGASAALDKCPYCLAAQGSNGFYRDSPAIEKERAEFLGDGKAKGGFPFGDGEVAQ